MDISKFSRDELLKPRSFNPELPDGQIAKEIEITIRSFKSDSALDDIDRALKNEVKSNQEAIKSEIRHAKTILVGFKGIKVNGKELKDDADGIDFLLTNFDWLRMQIIDKSRDDKFFLLKD